MSEPAMSAARPGRLADFAARTLRGEGSLVERHGETGLEVVLPEALRARLGFAELVELSEEGRAGHSIGYGSESLVRVASHALSRGGTAVLRAPIRSVPHAVPDVYQGFNVSLRKGTVQEGQYWTLIGAFRYRAACDDQREGTFRAAASMEGGVALELPDLSRHDLEAADPSVLSCDRLSPGARALVAAARERAIGELEGFRTAIARRHRRDAERLRRYFSEFRRDLRRRLGRRRSAKGLAAKLEALPEEHRRRREQLAAQYRMRVQIDPLGIMAIRAGGANCTLRVKRRGASRIIRARWNGLLRAWEPLRCDGCGQPIFGFALCEAAEHTLCAECWNHCGSGGRRPCFRCAGEPERNLVPGVKLESCETLPESGVSSATTPLAESSSVASRKAPRPPSSKPVRAATIQGLEELAARVRSVLGEASEPLLSTELRKQTGADAPTLRKVLRPWLEEGRVGRTGERRGTRYYWIDDSSAEESIP